MNTIRTLFLDVGGVLLTNGWDRRSRQQAAAVFQLDHDEMNERHNLTFDTYEEGKLSLDEYLRRVVFHKPRPFTPEEFKRFMFNQSQQLPHMLDYARELKAKYGLKVAAVSNEGRELTEYRVQTFGLREVFDTFLFSCFVHVRKPDVDIYRLALDVTQAAPEEVAYLDDRAMFAEVASGLGIHGIHHQSYESSRAALAELGLTLP
ncbi:MAG: HAD family phosphatase [Gemmataceae bacterium]|nr:HAD family phosphatase [Gemmataceae bacterium]MDW8265552.1 HAD family phosphatase [Gemmataceae bacterium]